MEYNTDTCEDYKNYKIFYNFCKIRFNSYQSLTIQYSIYLGKYSELSDFDKIALGESEIHHELKLTPYTLFTFHRLLLTDKKIQQLLQK